MTSVWDLGCSHLRTLRDTSPLKHLFLFLFCVYAYMPVVVYMSMSMHVNTRGPHLVCSSVDKEFTLIGWPASSRTFVLLCPRLWDYRHALMLFTWVLLMELRFSFFFEAWSHGSSGLELMLKRLYTNPP